jgi:hypothetical protein
MDGNTYKTCWRIATAARGAGRLIIVADGVDNGGHQASTFPTATSNEREVTAVARTMDVYKDYWVQHHP